MSNFSKLLFNASDGSLENVVYKPKGKYSEIKIKMKYYNSEDVLTDAFLFFEEVVAFDFEVNCFDNSIKSELCGFYEIEDKAYKIFIVEKIFKNRREGFLHHNDYNYDINDENDILNNKENLNEIISSIEEYHLFEQEMLGGIFYILAKRYEIIS